MDYETDGDGPNDPIDQPRGSWWRRVVGDIKSKSQERKARKQRETSQDKAARRTANATYWIAAFTVVLAAVSAFQGWELYNGGTDTHALASAASSQADASKKIAEAISSQAAELVASVRQAARLADATEKAIDVSERPWLGFTGIVMKDNIEVGKVLSATVGILNSGRSPAIHVQIEFTIQTLCKKFPKVPHYPGITRSSKRSISLVMPNIPRTSQDSTAPAPLISDDMAKIRRNDCELYSYARVTYSDTLTGSRAHWRHMCAFWDKTSPKSFNDCGFYNDGDEDYPDGKEPN